MKEGEQGGALQPPRQGQLQKSIKWKNKGKGFGGAGFTSYQNVDLPQLCNSRPCPRPSFRFIHLVFWLIWGSQHPQSYQQNQGHSLPSMNSPGTRSLAPPGAYQAQSPFPRGSSAWRVADDAWRSTSSGRLLREQLFLKRIAVPLKGVITAIQLQ